MFWRKKTKETAETKKTTETTETTEANNINETKATNWDDYIFDDGEVPYDPNNHALEGRIDKQRWLPREGETRLALCTAIDNISSGHYSGRCAMCQKIDISSPYGFGHYRYPALKHSAQLGCPLCQFFLDNIRIIDNLCSADLTIDQKTCSLWYKHAGYPATAFELFIKRGDKFVNNRSIFLRNISEDPFSEECLDVARGWLDRCVKDHERCLQGEDFAAPTRLLNISKPPPFLCTPEAKGVRYAALSYCWGEDKAVTTKKANIESHEKGIDYSSLPKTFRDAIVVAQKLDINYLWIDSLCIIQDDENDWEAECIRMGDYYQNSYVTISALDSSRSNEGFLYMRPETSVTRLFETSTTHIRPATTFDRRKIFENAALSKRGWTLQERLLSTRILHYSSHEMFWECKTCSAREGSAKEHVDPVDSRSLGSYEGEDFKRALQHLDSNSYSPSHGAFAVWYRLVRQYTRRSLSRPSDRLPAISALAALFTTTTNCNYMAGLWAEDSHGLLWLRDRDELKTSMPKTSMLGAMYSSYYDESKSDRAPSWSWAAVDGPVIFAPYDEEHTSSTNDATIIQQRVRPTGSGKFGAVLSGSLTLRAFSKKVQCLPKDLDPEKSISGYVKEHCQIDDKYYKAGFPQYRYSMDVFDEVGKHFGYGCRDGIVFDYRLDECVAVWVAEYIYNGRTPTKAVYFLLIAPVINRPHKWRRVGLGITKDDPNLQGFFTTVFDCYEWKEFVLM